MPIQLLINIFIALLWMFLNDAWSILSLFTGYLVGLVVIFSMRKFFPKRFYIITLFAVVKLFFVFSRELISSSVLVIRQVLRPKLNITPGIFTMKTELEGEWEITLLALLLSLTPGSVVLEVSPDNKTFYIHAMDIPASSNAVLQAKDTFEKAIREVTR